MAIKRSSQRSRSHRKGSTIVCRIREGGGGRFRQNKHLSGEVLPYSLPIQSKLNILQWMKFSMCKRGLCTHWLIWLFRKWVGVETMKLWVQWLWGEGSYRSILLLFGRSLDVSCLMHSYYTSYTRLLYILYTVTIHLDDRWTHVLYTVTIHTIVEAACTLVVSTKIERLCGQCHGHRSLWHRKISCWCLRRRRKTSSF